MASKQDTRAAVLAAAQALFALGDVVEMRIPQAGPKQVVAGYFDDFGKLADAAANWSGKAPGVYVTLNAINPDLLARAANRAVPYAKFTTQDSDVIRRRWFPIDFDPKRPAGISSNEAEHEAALDLADVCASYLASLGWPAPILADSGNGAHLLYPIDLPNDDESKAAVAGALKALDELFSNASVSVDTGNFNAARIWKLYGTMSCKGDHTTARPHRESKILDGELAGDAVVTLEQLRALVPAPAETTPAPAAASSSSAKPAAPSGPYTGERFDIDGWIAKFAADVKGPRDDRGGRKWVFDICPFNSAHSDRSAMIGETPAGAVYFTCHHQGCKQAGNDWAKLRDLLEGPRPVRTTPPAPAAATKPKAKVQTPMAPAKDAFEPDGDYLEPDEWDDGPSSSSGNHDEPDFGPVEPLPVDELGLNPYFQVLGFKKGDAGKPEYVFFRRTASVVITLTAAQLTKSNLMSLAPINFWERHYKSKNGLNVDAAANALIRAAEAAHFNDRAIRGRGAWFSAGIGSPVVHLGDRLVVDGSKCELDRAGDGYIYEVGEPLNLGTADPLTSAEAYKLVELCQHLPWDRFVNAKLLAGWLAIAPICGALKWRPHIWLTGAPGTGKSWVFREIVRACLGEAALAVQSETSEAGLRQALGCDALPVVFDEAEGEDRHARERMQRVMSLMRAASSEDGGLMVKGTSGGQAKRYSIRSCFAFASISDQIQQKADADRITVLTLVRERDEAIRSESWVHLQRAHLETITPEFIRRLQARVIKLMPVILENARVFAKAAAVVLGTARAGDQIGALLAGAYALHTDKVIGFDDALAWVQAQDWSSEKALVETTDEHTCLTRILELTVRVETTDSTAERTVGELYVRALGEGDDMQIHPREAAARLRRLGIRPDADGIVISNTAAAIKNALKDTPWSAAHNKVLLRIDGAEATSPLTFCPGVTGRAVKIPRASIGL